MLKNRLECYPEPNEQMECKCYCGDPFFIIIGVVVFVFSSFGLSHKAFRFAKSFAGCISFGIASDFQHLRTCIELHRPARIRTRTHIEKCDSLNSHRKLVFKSLTVRVCAHFATLPSVCTVAVAVLEWAWKEGRAKVSDSRSGSFDCER